MDDLLREFLVETGENLDTVDARLVQLEHEPDNQDILRAIFRLVHTIKGTCGFLGLPRLEALAHAAETVMGQFRDGAPVTRMAVTLILSSLDRIKLILAGLEKSGEEPAGDDADLIAALEAMADSAGLPGAAAGADAQSAIADLMAAADPLPRDDLAADLAASSATLRVNMDTLEQLMTMVSELVLTRNQLLEVSRQTHAHPFNAPLQRLSLVTGELQDCVMKTRMQPISHAYQKLPRLVRDLGVELGKTIYLAVHGGDTELDRQVLDLIKDPLTHLVRNAADHGIETPQERVAAGKPAQGVITVNARHSGGALILTISDDGRGLNFPRIRAKALERGLVSEAELERMSDAQASRLIFHPGFSTAEEVSAVSGRGVGMDVVAANVGLAGGHVDVQSRPHEGTCFTITLPLTLAILPALLVGVNNQRFALPQSVIAELMRIGPGSDARIDRMDNGAMLSLRGVLYPLLSLSAVLGFMPDAEAFNATGGFVALLSIDERQFAVMIDTVLQTEEIVVKPISSSLRHLSLYSGCTILGDGSVVLIFEPNALARMVGSAPAAAPLLHNVPEALSAPVKTMPVLLLRAGSRRQAIPLSMVMRIERLTADQMEWSGSQAVIQHGGALMPVIRTDGLSMRDAGDGRVCLIIEYQGKKLGLIADEIIDVVETDFDLTCDSNAPGLLGSAIVQGTATEIIDVISLLTQSFPDLLERGAAAASALPLLLVESCTFIRDMLVPVLRAAGFAVSFECDLTKVMTAIPHQRIIIIDLDETMADALDLICAAKPAGSILMGLSSQTDAAANAAVLKKGVTAVLSKFDRRGLIAELHAHMQSERRAA